jgi:hypothetical protein
VKAFLKEKEKDSDMRMVCKILQWRMKVERHQAVVKRKVFQKVIKEEL